MHVRRVTREDDGGDRAYAANVTVRPEGLQHVPNEFRVSSSSGGSSMTTSISVSRQSGTWRETPSVCSLAHPMSRMSLTAEATTEALLRNLGTSSVQHNLKR